MSSPASVECIFSADGKASHAVSNIQIKKETDHFSLSKTNTSPLEVGYFANDLPVDDEDEDCDVKENERPSRGDVDDFLIDMDSNSETSEVDDVEGKERSTRGISLVKTGTVDRRSYATSDCNGMELGDLHGGSVTLWQFLLELLIGNQHPEIIQWTSQEGEFMLLQAEEVARLWGMRKNKNHRMNYDKLSRALRYYYQKNIIKKVHGHKFVYRFVYLPEEGLKSFRRAVNGGEIRHLTPSVTEGHTEIISPTWPLSNTVESDVPEHEVSREKSEVLPEIKIEAQPCCTCRCHASLSESLHSGRDVQNSPDSGSQAKLPRLSHPLPSSHPTPLTPESAMHHKRHTINMQRLAQQLRLQTHRSEPPTRRLSGQSPPGFSMPTSPPVNASNSSSESLPPAPFMDFSQARLYPPSGFPPASTSGQQCVWMPIPVAMLSRWWQSLANLSATTTPDESTNGQESI